MWKFLSVLFFILSFPIIVLIILASLILFGKAPQCPPITEQVSTNSTQLKLQNFQKTGSVTFTNAEITSALQGYGQDKIKDIRVCITGGKVNASGTFLAGNFSPTFYLTTEIKGDPSLQLENTEVSLGWLGKVPGSSKLIGSIIQGAANDKLKEMFARGDTTYTIKIEEDSIKFDTTKPQTSKKKS